MSNDPPLFNTTARRLDEPQRKPRPSAALVRMRDHAHVERMLREERIADNLRAAWIRAFAEFKESR